MSATFFLGHPPRALAAASLLSVLGTLSCKGRPAPSADASAPAQVLLDFAGRRVALARPPSRVLTFSHSFAILVALAPDLLAARPGPFKPNPQTARFLPPGVADLPQLGAGPDLDPEAIKALHVDLAVGWSTAAFEREQLVLLDRVSVPAVLVGVDRLDQYPATFRFLGRALGREARGEALASAVENALDRMKAQVAAIPEGERRSVYYAEGMDGLTSQCGLEGRSEVIRLAGGRNALACDGAPGTLSPADVESHNAPVDLERLLALDPDAIVARFDKAAEKMRSDPRWQRLRAVKEGRVWAVPQLPFNWFDRPPSYMRALGMQWLARRLYPERVSVDLRAETARFYALFFRAAPSEADLDLLLGRGAP